MNPALNQPALIGPQFYMEDGKLMFVHVIDDKNTVGPRIATDGDIEAHGAASAFTDMDGHAKAHVETIKGQAKEAEEKSKNVTSAKGEVEKRFKDLAKRKKEDEEKHAVEKAKSTPPVANVPGLAPGHYLATGPGGPNTSTVRGGTGATGPAKNEEDDPRRNAPKK